MAYVDISAAPGPRLVAVLDNANDFRQTATFATGQVSTLGATIVYRLYELSDQNDPRDQASPSDKIIMVMGFASSADAWMPILKNLACRALHGTRLEVCVFDNRGVGQSTVPTSKKAYTTSIMSQDAFAVMDHLGWSKAHVVGHSMGGMIATKMASAHPERIASLTLISVTGGGLQSVPLNWPALKAALRGALARDHQARARVDLAFHYSPQLLARKDPKSGRLVGDILMDEYVRSSIASGLQPRHGQDGHLHAVMKHSVSDRGCEAIRAGGFPIKVIHGGSDILAHPRHAARIALRLGTAFVVLEGAHFVVRDCADQIADELLSMVEAVRQGRRVAVAVNRTTCSATYLSPVCCGCCG